MYLLINVGEGVLINVHALSVKCMREFMCMYLHGCVYMSVLILICCNYGCICYIMCVCTRAHFIMCIYVLIYV